MVAIEKVADELLRVTVLDGIAFDTIIAVGQPVDAEGPPTSGTWTPVTTAHIAGVDQPARLGESYAWHDARVQRAPELFVSDDAPPETTQKAIATYNNAAMSPEPSGTRRLEPGPAWFARSGALSVARATDWRSLWHRAT
jgi:hypothetical protein